MNNENLVGIKQVSFDVWGTLIAANPLYTDARTKYLSQKFGIDSLTAKQIYTSVKLQFDRAAETMGVGYAHQFAYQTLYAALGICADEDSLQSTIGAFVDMFERYPPIQPPEVVQCLRQLADAGIQMNIASNTNFMPGEVMRHVVFKQWGIPFVATVFSDEVLCSKPHPEFFARVVEQSAHSPHEILHVGDNAICDVSGATKAGMRVLWVTNPLNTAANLQMKG